MGADAFPSDGISPTWGLVPQPATGPYGLPVSIAERASVCRYVSPEGGGRLAIRLAACGPIPEAFYRSGGGGLREPTASITDPWPAATFVPC